MVKPCAPARVRIVPFVALLLSCARVCSKNDDAMERANVLARQGQLAEAANAYELAIESAKRARPPRAPPPHAERNLGSVLAGLGHLHRAETAFRAAVTSNPQDTTALVFHAAVLTKLAEGASTPTPQQQQQQQERIQERIQERQDYQTAIRACVRAQHVLELQQSQLRRSEVAQQQEQIGMLLRTLEQHTLSARSFKRAAAVQPTSARLQYILGTACLDAATSTQGSYVTGAGLHQQQQHRQQQAQLQSAGDALRRAAELRPTHAPTYSKLGGAYANAGDIDAAVMSLRAAVSIDRTRHADWGALGRLLELRGEETAAMEAHGKAVRAARRALEVACGQHSRTQSDDSSIIAPEHAHAELLTARVAQALSMPAVMPGGKHTITQTILRAAQRLQSVAKDLAAVVAAVPSHSASAKKAVSNAICANVMRAGAVDAMNTNTDEGESGAKLVLPGVGVRESAHSLLAVPHRMLQVLVPSPYLPYWVDFDIATTHLGAQARLRCQHLLAQIVATVQSAEEREQHLVPADTIDPGSDDGGEGGNMSVIATTVTEVQASSQHSVSPVRLRHSRPRLRLGFISCFFGQRHTLALMLGPVIRGLCRDFDVVVFHAPASADMGSHKSAIAQNHDILNGDSNTSAICQGSQLYNVYLSVDVGAARNALHQENLDALVYCDTALCSTTALLALGARAAPVQIATLNNGVGVALPQTFDYYVDGTPVDVDADGSVGIDHGVDKHYAEQLVRLDALPFAVPQPSVPVAPAAAAMRTSFGLPLTERFPRLYMCLQPPFKLHPAFDELLLRILLADDHGAVVLLEGRHPAWQKALRERLLVRAHQFEAQQRSQPQADGTVADAQALLARIIFVPAQPPGRFAELASLGSVHLDPPPFGGGRSIGELLLAGIPVVTMPTAQRSGRLALALYRELESVLTEDTKPTPGTQQPPSTHDTIKRESQSLLVRAVARDADAYVHAALEIASEREHTIKQKSATYSNETVAFRILRAVRAGALGARALERSLIEWTRFLKGAARGPLLPAKERG